MTMIYWQQPGGCKMANQEHADLQDMLHARVRRDLVRLGRSVRVTKGQSIVAQDSPSSTVYLILEGRMQAVLFAGNGREVSLRELGPDQLFGELGAIDGHARSAGVVALTSGRLLAVNQADFRAWLRTSPDAADWLIRRFASQIRGLTERIFELSTLSVRARLHCELIRIARAPPADPVSAPTHAELANRIGSHREAVTRELRALADQNIVRSGRRSLAILDLARLEAELVSNLNVPSSDGGQW